MRTMFLSTWPGPWIERAKRWNSQEKRYAKRSSKTRIAVACSSMIGLLAFVKINCDGDREGVLAVWKQRRQQLNCAFPAFRKDGLASAFDAVLPKTHRCDSI